MFAVDRFLSLFVSAGWVAAMCTVLVHPAMARENDVRNAEAARQLLGLALENIHLARCGSSPCAPATDAEKASPPITDGQAQGIVAAGLLSAFAEHCKLDWQAKSFRPLMQRLRTGLLFNERQMALAGVMHGIMKQSARTKLTDKPCTDQMRASTERDLATSAPSASRQ